MLPDDPRQVDKLWEQRIEADYRDDDGFDELE